jgi:glycosyltransferase involved in cell wall biosynthesis
MRVCLISGSYPPIFCGIGDYVQRLAAGMAHQGAEVAVLTSAGQAQPVRNGSVTVWPIVPRWTLRAVGPILAQLRDLAADVVNVQYPTQLYGRDPVVNLLPFFIRSRCGIPALTTVHEFSTYRRLGRLRIGLSMAASNGVILPDRANLAALAAAYPRWRGKLRHVPLGANIEPAPGADFARDRQRASYGARPSDVVLAYFGFVSSSKGIETLLLAFKQALAAWPDGLRLLLIANRQPADERYGAYHRQIAGLLDQLALGDRVIWTGYLPPEAVSAALLSADVAVLPFADGAALRRTTLLSALAHGLPVISTLNPAPTGDALDETQGLRLTPTGDAEALAGAILTLAGDGDLRRRLSAAAVRFAAGFSWASIAAQTLAVYRDVREGR